MVHETALAVGIMLGSLVVYISALVQPAFIPRPPHLLFDPAVVAIFKKRGRVDAR